MAKSTKNLKEVTESEIGLQGQYKHWFLDYASYVILERAVPQVEDGLKPVQRRILHSMKEMDDGRFNKVANIIGQSMQYHPHGDASIGDALVNIGQKDLLIDTQGNWGDVRTGDDAAAPRYIEARLSKFALDVAFNPKTTNWQLSYDGRKNEPINLPMKFPLLLVQGADGIAVGLATKVIPHNFCEVIDAAIKHLKGKKFELFPDFLTGAAVDVTNYNDGARGGKLRVRATIEEVDKKTLLIKDVPYGITTTQLKESIVKANDDGKIKIKKVTDNTAQQVAVLVDLAPGISPDITVDALYAFTDCEVSISPNTCVIHNNKPIFTTASNLLRIATDDTKQLLQQELEIKLKELQDKWHFTSLEKIFFEEQLYKELEKKINTWDMVLQAIQDAFIPFSNKLKKEVTREDVVKLTEKPVRRIYKLDIDELNTQIIGLDNDIAKVQHNLEHLTEYAIEYFDTLLKKYGKGRERKTEIKLFDTIQAKHVAIANTKIYMNKEDGFLGTALKKDELIAECSDLDDVIVITKSGLMKIVKVSEKTYIGKDIIHAAIFNKNDDRTTYNVIYTDGNTSISYAKRFNVTGITRDKGYDITKGADKSKINYLSVNANGEAETVKVNLSATCTARYKEFDFQFIDIGIKTRSSVGIQVTKYPIRFVKLTAKGKSTLSGRDLWFDPVFGRINLDEKGKYLGKFEADDRIIVMTADGQYELVTQELTQRFDVENTILIEAHDPNKIYSVVYLDADKQQYNIKRFKIETTTIGTKFTCIKDGKANKLVAATSNTTPILVVSTGKGQLVRSAQFKIEKMVEVMGWRSIGAKLIEYNKHITMHWQGTDAAEQTQLF